MTQKDMELGWHPDEPTARGVARAVSQAISEGLLKPGTKLPPIRSVARQLDLSPTTVNSAWKMLARTGTIHTDGRRGTTVTDPHAGSSRYRRATDGHQLFAMDLSTGVPDPALLPDLRMALKSLTTAAVTGGYLDDPVLPELIEVLRRRWPYAADKFTILDGAMDALEAATRAVTRFGDRVIVEDPGFPLLFDQLETAGTDVIGVPVDEQGMQPDALAAALDKPAAAIYIQPRAHNPTGVSLTPERGRALARVIEAADTVVIEDDSAGDVATTAAISLGQWLPERTLHIRSFSKSHGPDLRLAAMSGPADLIGQMVARRQLGQGWSSRLLQQVLLNLLTQKETVKQIEYAREAYRQRRTAVLEHLAAHGIQASGADGFNIWVPVVNETAALVRLASQGIGAAAGAPFSVVQADADHIRVTVGPVDRAQRELADAIAVAARVDRSNSGR